MAVHPSCLRLLPWLAQTQNKINDKTGVYLLTKVLKLVLLSNYYPSLPSTHVRTATNRWNLRKIGGAIAWRNKVGSS
jgi:hypothetical protein